MKPANSFSRNNNKSQNNSINKSDVNAIYNALSKVSNRLASLEQMKGKLKDTFSHEREEGLKEMYADYRDNILADYIYGIYHPDVVFKDNLDIKSPSYMPVPTTTFRFKETFTLTPNASGNFCIYWSPNYLGSQEVLNQIGAFYHGCYSNVYVNVDPLLDGTTAGMGTWQARPFRVVTQGFDKYRLTSACIKVMYTGQKIQQSGMIAAAASYVKSYRVIAGWNAQYDEELGPYTLLNRWSGPLSQFGDFDNIRQGQWAETCSLVDRPDGITCVYVPTDPLNQVFVDNGSTIDYVDRTSQIDAETKYIGWCPTNANISYAICGYGIQSTLPCITVEMYYNFEIIVRQEQFPYFSPKSASPKLLKHINVLNAIGGLVSSTGLITKTRDHNSSTIWDKVRAAFSKSGKLFIDVYSALSPLYKALV